MKLDSIGEIFYDGRIINLDKPSTEIIDTVLEKIEKQKEELGLKLDNLIVEMQK